MPRLRRWTALALLGLIGAVAGIALVEIVLRLKPAPEGRSYMVADPVLHHRLRPSTTRVVLGAPFSTNTLGLRGDEIAIPKPPGTFRIIMLGDSFTEGRGLTLDQTVSRQVEKLLAGRACPRHEVINAGVTSYSPLIEYVQLKTLGLRLEPDLVVLGFDMTDVYDDFIRTQSARLGPDGLPLAVPSDRRADTAVIMPPLPKPPALRFLDPVERVANRLAVYQALRKAPLGQKLFGRLKLTPERLEASGLLGDLRYDPMAITRDIESPELDAAWALTSRYLVGIRKLAQDRGIPFALVVYPHAHQVGATESLVGRRSFGLGPGLFTSERPFRILETLGRREGFPVINLLPLFREREASRGALFWDHDIHHNPQGAAVFAEGIVAGLVEHGLLPRSCP